MFDPELAVTSLHEHGLRVTPQRRAVMLALAGSTTHPRVEDVAEQVARQLPGISLSTVYKTLEELACIGLIRQLEGFGPMRFDPDPSHHVHLACKGCGSIIDVPVDERILADLRGEAESVGATVDHISIELHGTCPACGSARERRFEQESQVNGNAKRARNCGRMEESHG